MFSQSFNLIKSIPVARIWDRFLFDSDKGRIGAGFLGASVPCLPFGNAVFASLFGLAFLFLLPEMRDPILRWRWRRLFLNPVGALGAATAGWWAISSVFSIDPFGSFEVLLRLILFICAALTMLVVLAERRDLVRLALSVFLIGFSLSVFIGALAMYARPDVLVLLRPFAGDEITPIALFKSYMSVIAVAVPVVLWAGWNRGGLWFALALAASSAGGFILWGNGAEPGRAALAGLFGALLLILLLRALRRFTPSVRRWTVAALSLVVIVGGVLSLIALPKPSVDAADHVAHPLPLVDSHRQAIWGFVFEKATERPFFGFGLNTINKVEGAQDDVPGIGSEYVPSHPHNWFLEVLSETGFIGAFLLLASQFVLFLRIARQAIGGRAGGYALLAVLAAFWISSLANFSIWAAWWQVAFLAVAILPGARFAGSLLSVPEDRPPPELDWRRGGLIGLAVFLTLVLALVWYARRTDEGYVLYKRLKADSPYLYEEIRPEHLAVDPGALIEPKTMQELNAARLRVQEAIWGEDGLPSARQPAEITVVDADPYRVSHGHTLQRVERFTVPIEANYESVGYIFQPEEPTGEAVVYLHGYAGDISQARPLLGALLRDGVTVAALNFPGYGENAFVTYDHPRFGPIGFDYDYLLYFMDLPMRVYIEPAVIAANRLREIDPSMSVHVAGFSAGGWVSAVAAAADPRFVKSASVASFLPMYLRDRRDPGEWTPPHLYSPLIHAANYLDIPLLAASGTDRAYLQIFNRYDRCCYMNRRGKLYQPAIEDRLEQIGVGGAFGVAIDETHAQHQVSAWARERLVDFLKDEGSLREDEQRGLSDD